MPMPRLTRSGSLGIALTGSFVTGVFAVLMFMGAYALRHHFFSRFRYADLLYMPNLIYDILLMEGLQKDWFMTLIHI